MNSLHQEYLDRGESIYTGRVDSIQVHPGRNRVKFVWEIKADPRITKTEISWREGAEKKNREFDVIRTGGNAFMMETIIDNLDEGTYYFEFLTKDDKGNRSLAFGKTVEVFGDQYLSLLKARTITNITIRTLNDPLLLQWSAADNGVVETWVMYESESMGKAIKHTVLSNEEESSLTDFVPGGTYTVVTCFCPAPAALDTFFITSAEATFPTKFFLDKTGWIPYATGTHVGNGGGLSCLLDDNYSSYWYSPTGEFYNTEKPLYVGFDMLHERMITEIALEKRWDTRMAEIMISLDNVSWTPIGSILIDNNDERGRGSLVLEQAVKARYVRLYLTKSSNEDGRGTIWEIDLYGYEIRDAPTPGIFRYDRSDWSIVAFSSNNEGFEARTLIDNILTTFWRPRTNPYAPLPHWAVIDIGSPKEIAKIVTYRRQQNAYTRTVQYFIGNNPDPNAAGWVKIGEGVMSETTGDNNSGGEVLTIDIPESMNTAQGRYLKMVLPDTNCSGVDTSGAVAEIYLYGKKN
jgi:hypothetical protein